MDPDRIVMDEHTMRIWGGCAAFAFGSLMLVRAYLDGRRSKNPAALRVGLCLFTFGAILLVAALLRL